jgi:hypothetical protein
MTTHYNRIPGAHLDPAAKVLQAALHSWTRGAQEAAPPPPRAFVTVSRQPGAGGISFSHRLAQSLNATGDNDWSAWDRELVEKVSAEHNISQELIDMIPDRQHSWFTALVDAICSHPPTPEFAELRAYKRVIVAIRALAEQGHAVIVGQGGTFVTEQMPGAIHLRLVAPLEHRIKHVAEREHLSLHGAAARAAEMDVNRAEFFRRFWHRKTIGPEEFTMTLNAAELSVEEMVETTLPLVRSREARLAALKSEGKQPSPASAGVVERKRCHETFHCI